ncbi:hypothetical protein KQH49_08640 [Mycetohabitans sp. B5]|uniref:hypothetical protein n=1 Tax=Mycetohabitans TaxID=2571159 RepID=UPI0011B0ACD4|nr:MULTISPECIES: hypothetical protein [Mycetohabitans]MCG1055015.1 hypothetical protein [Mycetohabitans sp. B5]
MDLASLQQLLDETQDIQFEPSLRTDPVVALWYWLPRPPNGRRPSNACSARQTESPDMAMSSNNS